MKNKKILFLGFLLEKILQNYNTEVVGLKLKLRCYFENDCILQMADKVQTASKKDKSKRFALLLIFSSFGEELHKNFPKNAIVVLFELFTFFFAKSLLHLSVSSFPEQVSWKRTIFALMLLK